MARKPDRARGHPLDDPIAESLAMAVAGGQSITAAARAAGITRQTVHNRLRDPVFAERVREIQAEAVECIVARLTGLGEKAVQALEELLESRIDGIRIQAATLVLAQIKAFREHTQFAARLDAIEEADRQRLEEEPTWQA